MARRRAWCASLLVIVVACTSAPSEPDARGARCFGDWRAPFPHAVKDELKACRTASDCAIEYVRIDRCGTILAVGVSTSAVRPVHSCIAASAAAVVGGCASEPPRAEVGMPALASGGFQVECADQRCRTYFRSADVPPGSRARLGHEWLRLQREQLERFAWVDRDAGIAQIPIERAMDLVLAREADAAASAPPR